METEEAERMKVEDLGRTGVSTETLEHRTSDGSGLQKQYFIFGGIAFFILIIVFTLSFRAHRDSTVNLNSVKNSLEMLERNFPQLAGQVIKLQQSVSELNESGKSLTQRMDELSERFDRLQRRSAAADAETEIPTDIHPKPAEQIKGRYHEVRAGETLYRIARTYGISVAELCRLNQISPDQPIEPGQKLRVPPEELD